MRLVLLIALGLVAACSGGIASRYEAEVDRCIANERNILSREGTSREDDELELARERARCDSALQAIIDEQRTEEE